MRKLAMTNAPSQNPETARTALYGDLTGRFVHNLILESCHKNAARTAIIDPSCNRRISYAEYGELVESVARGFAAAGVKPGDIVAIFLANSWEFCVAYHAATLAGAVPTLLNPTYREREVCYQLENSGAALLITDGPNLDGINLASLPNLRRIYYTRQPASGAEPFSNLLIRTAQPLPAPSKASGETLAALPYSSGTTGLPKGVMLTHSNLVSNVYQLLGPNGSAFNANDIFLCFLPLYHTSLPMSPLAGSSAARGRLLPFE